jgi:hypothetical protein
MVLSVIIPPRIGKGESGKSGNNHMSLEKNTGVLQI